MRILIAANDSMVVNKILRFSKQFVDAASEPTTILKILDPGKDRPPIQSKAYREQAREILGTNNLTICTRIGQPVEVIIRETRTGDYDLAIVGDQRTRWLGKIFIRSSAKHIAEQAACSVMIVRGKIGHIQNILFCDSGVEDASIVQKFNAKLAGLLKGCEEITILHIMSQISAGPGIRGEQLRSGADELINVHSPEGNFLSRDVQTFSELGIHTHPKVRHGLVVNEILFEACSGNYDLVIIGTNINQGWGRVLLEDLSHQILTQIDRPVLVVR
jgi:nucleotide-binding universal stress UspA family protein